MTAAAALLGQMRPPAQLRLRHHEPARSTGSAITNELRDAVRRHKAEILPLLSGARPRRPDSGLLLYIKQQPRWAAPYLHRPCVRPSGATRSRRRLRGRRPVRGRASRTPSGT